MFDHALFKAATLIRCAVYCLVIATLMSFSAVSNAGNTCSTLFNEKSTSSNLLQTADDLNDIFQQNIRHIVFKLNSIFSSIYGKIVYRTKSTPSIAHKLQVFKVFDYEKGIEVIQDGIGTKLILNSLTAPAIELFVQRLEQAILQNDIYPVEISNYHGRGIKPYLTRDQVDRLLRATKATGRSVVYNSNSDTKRSGYTTFQINCRLPKGLFFELQVRGSYVDKIAHAEHVVYDFVSGKVDLTKSLDPISQGLVLLPPEYIVLYSLYLNNGYRWARRVESGEELPVPNLPLELRALPQLSLHSILRNSNSSH